MKQTLLTIFFFMVFGYAVAQVTTFNKRLSFDRPSAILNGVEVDSNGYTAVGIITLDSFPYTVGNVFAKFDLEGNLLSNTFLEAPGKTYEIWLAGLQKEEGETYVTAGYTIDSTVKILLIKYALNGDTIFTKEFHNPLIEGGFLNLEDILIDSTGYLLIGSVAGELAPPHITQILILRTNKEGELLWQKVYEIDQLDEDGNTIISTSDGGFIIGGRKDNLHLVDIDNLLRTYLFKIDSLGNQQWTWTSLLHRREQGVAGMAMTSDNGLVIATARGTEEVNAGSADLLWDCYIFKVDSLQQFIWGTYFREWDANELNRFYDMIKVKDGSGFVAVGEQAVVYEEANDGENLYDIGGYIVKVSPEGDSLWSRLIIYPYLESFEDWHYFRDVKETPDGGFILVGKARDFLQSPQGQQAWLVKTDEYGCVVPGCHLTTETTNAGVPVLALKLFPNPANDILNVFVNLKNPYETSEMQIINASGQIQYRQKLSVNEATYVLPIHTLTPGMYWVSIIDDREQVQSVRSFIKQ